METHGLQQKDKSHGCGKKTTLSSNTSFQFQKVAEVLGESNDFLASTVRRKLALRRIVESHWYSSRVRYSQGKLRLYTTLKERPGFETYLTLKNPKFRQAIIKLRISAHKLPIETGRYDQKRI